MCRLPSSSTRKSRGLLSPPNDTELIPLAKPATVEPCLFQDAFNGQKGIDTIYVNTIHTWDMLFDKNKKI